MNDTIFALATAPGRSALAILRLSGPSVVRSLASLGIYPPPRERVASLRALYDTEGELIDRAIVLRFEGPRSFTGEDMAELHVHGGEAVIDAVTVALLESGLRLAQPGEMTRRAFENGKLELDQAEAVADLIEAATAAQARQAVRQLGGALGRRYRDWRQALIESLARLEAQVDFADEELPPEIGEQAAASLRRLAEDIDVALADGARGERIRDGYRIAVIGAPNAGKSTLFNALLRRDAAIVTPTPGSTRDVLEASLPLGPYRAVLADMAGLRAATEAVEVEGVRRARAWAESADLRLWLVDGSASSGAWREAAAMAQPADICLLTKADLAEGSDAPDARAHAERAASSVVRVSLVAADGADLVRERLDARVAADLAGGDFPAITRHRHRLVLNEAKNHLRRAIADLGRPELAAEGVRLAARALDQVSGRIGAEDVLAEVFASFCIGK